MWQMPKKVQSTVRTGDGVLTLHYWDRQTDRRHSGQFGIDELQPVSAASFRLLGQGGVMEYWPHGYRYGRFSIGCQITPKLGRSLITAASLSLRPARWHRDFIS